MHELYFQESFDIDLLDFLLQFEFLFVILQDLHLDHILLVYLHTYEILQGSHHILDELLKHEENVM